MKAPVWVNNGYVGAYCKLAPAHQVGHSAHVNVLRYVAGLRVETVIPVQCLGMCVT